MELEVTALPGPDHAAVVERAQHGVATEVVVVPVLQEQSDGIALASACGGGALGGLDDRSVGVRGGHALERRGGTGVPDVHQGHAQVTTLHGVLGVQRFEKRRHDVDLHLLEGVHRADAPIVVGLVAAQSTRQTRNGEGTVVAGQRVDRLTALDSVVRVLDRVAQGVDRVLIVATRLASERGPLLQTLGDRLVLATLHHQVEPDLGVGVDPQLIGLLLRGIRRKHLLELGEGGIVVALGEKRLRFVEERSRVLHGRREAEAGGGESCEGEGQGPARMNHVGRSLPQEGRAQSGEHQLGGEPVEGGSQYGDPRAFDGSKAGSGKGCGMIPGVQERSRKGPRRTWVRSIPPALPGQPGQATNSGPS